MQRFDSEADRIASRVTGTLHKRELHRVILGVHYVHCVARLVTCPQVPHTVSWYCSVYVFWCLINVFIHHDQRREQTRLAADYSRSSTTTD